MSTLPSRSQGCSTYSVLYLLSYPRTSYQFPDKKSCAEMELNHRPPTRIEHPCHRLLSHTPDVRGLVGRSHPFFATELHASGVASLISILALRASSFLYYCNRPSDQGSPGRIRRTDRVRQIEKVSNFFAWLDHRSSIRHHRRNAPLRPSWQTRSLTAPV
jgi:hypothetical protein